MYTVISPVLSEKTAAGMSNGQYVLTVTEYATKTTIKGDLKKLFNVDAISVRIVNLPAKEVRFRAKKGVRSLRRKAYVQLKKSQTLPGFELKKDEKEPKAEKSDKKTKKEETN